MVKSNLDLHLKGYSLGQTGAGVRQETAQVSQQVGGNKRQKERMRSPTLSERLGRVFFLFLFFSSLCILLDVYSVGCLLTPSMFLLLYRKAS